MVQSLNRSIDGWLGRSLRRRPGADRFWIFDFGFWIREPRSGLWSAVTCHRFVCLVGEDVILSAASLRAERRIGRDRRVQAYAERSFAARSVIGWMLRLLRMTARL